MNGSTTAIQMQNTTPTRLKPCHFTPLPPIPCVTCCSLATASDGLREAARNTRKARKHFLAFLLRNICLFFFSHLFLFRVGCLAGSNLYEVKANICFTIPFIHSYIVLDFHSIFTQGYISYIIYCGRVVIE